MEHQDLSLECQIFSEYLVGQKPSPYISRKYAQAHYSSNRPVAQEAQLFDRWLVTLARIHPWVTRAADSYSRFFSPTSVLRKKLILLLAILECCEPSQGFADMPELVPRSRFWTRCVLEGGIFLGVLGMAIIVLLPVHVGCRMYGWVLGWESSR